MERILFTPLLLISLFMSGCASLSSDQLDAIHAFSEEYQSIDLVPGQLINENAEMNRAIHQRNINRRPEYRDLLQACKSKVEECAALDTLYSGVRQQRQLVRQADLAAKSLNEAVRAFAVYAKALGSMAAVNHEEDLRGEAELLTRSLSTALIDVPKNLSAAAAQLEGEVVPKTTEVAVEPVIEKTDELASQIGAATFWMGQRYVRYQQAKAIKETVKTVDPILSSAIADVTAIINWMAGSNSQNLIGSFETIIPVTVAINKEISQSQWKAFQASLTADGLSPSSYNAVGSSSTREGLQAAIDQAQTDLKFLKALKESHQSLARGLERPRGHQQRFRVFIAESKQFIDEFKHAKKLQKALEKDLAASQQEAVANNASN